MSPTEPSIAEPERLRRVYRERTAAGLGQRYSLLNPPALAEYQSRVWALTERLRRAGIKSLNGRRVLEVGCGSGQLLSDIRGLGAEPELLAGVDLLADRAMSAQRLVPGADIRTCDATSLPWSCGTFDVVIQCTVFSSILSVGCRTKVAQEMQRVCRGGGVILWYDVFRNNPWNPALRAISPSEVKALFSGCKVSGRRVTLAAPLSRLMVRRTRLLHDLLEAVVILNTHFVAACVRRTDA